MAIRWEKEENGEYALVIDGWENGISSDPYSGLNYMLGVDLETPGEVAVGYGITTSVTSGGTLGNPIAKSKRYFPTYGSPSSTSTGAVQSYAILDDVGQIWEATSITGTWTFLSSSNSATGSTNKDGCAYFLGYLFKTRGANIDYWDGSTWHTGWQTTLTSGVQHSMHVGSDNILYITNGNGLASIDPNANPQNPNRNPGTFDPSTATTYTFSTQKLALPYNDVALSIVEIGSGTSAQSTLLTGGALNAIYPWDKQSLSYSLPINVADGYIGKMVAVNQNAFIFPGNTGGRGRIYITNGSQADLFYKIPDYIFGIQDPYYEWGDVIFHRNNLVFSFFPDQNAGTGVIQNFGYVWALNLSEHTTATGISLPTKSFRAISALPTSATFVTNATVLIGAENPNTKGFSYIAAWNDTSSSPGIGYSGTTAGIGSGAVLTDLMNVGTFIYKKTFSQVEYKLRTALASGENFSMLPIADGSVMSSLTFAPTPTAGVLSGVASVTFQANQWLQFIVGLTGNSASSGCRLKEIRLR